MNNIELNGLLTSLGDVTPLRFKMDVTAAREAVAGFGEWPQYNSYKPHIQRRGLSLTSLDGGMTGWPDLQSLAEVQRETGTRYREMDFTTPTPAFEALREVSAGLLSHFEPHLGRSHLLRLDAGGYFPWHRDSYGLDPRAFRVIVPLWNTGHGDWVFLLDDNRVMMEPGRAYFVNTRHAHCLFSFVDNCVQMVLNVGLTEEGVDALVQQLLYR